MHGQRDGRQCQNLCAAAGCLLHKPDEESGSTTTGKDLLSLCQSYSAQYLCTEAAGLVRQAQGRHRHSLCHAFRDGLLQSSGHMAACAATACSRRRTAQLLCRQRCLPASAGWPGTSARAGCASAGTIRRRLSAEERADQIEKAVQTLCACHCPGSHCFRCPIPLCFTSVCLMCRIGYIPGCMPGCKTYSHVLYSPFSCEEAAVFALLPVPGKADKHVKPETSYRGSTEPDRSSGHSPAVPLTVMIVTTARQAMEKCLTFQPCLVDRVCAPVTRLYSLAGQGEPSGSFGCRRRAFRAFGLWVRPGSLGLRDTAFAHSSPRNFTSKPDATGRQRAFPAAFGSFRKLSDTFGRHSAS